MGQQPSSHVIRIKKKIKIKRGLQCMGENSQNQQVFNVKGKVFIENGKKDIKIY